MFPVDSAQGHGRGRCTPCTRILARPGLLAVLWVSESCGPGCEYGTKCMFCHLATWLASARCLFYTSVAHIRERHVSRILQQVCMLSNASCRKHLKKHQEIQVLLDRSTRSARARRTGTGPAKQQGSSTSRPFRPLESLPCFFG